MRRLPALLLLVGLLSPAAASAAPTPSPTPDPAAAGRGVNVVPDPSSPHRSRSGTFLELGRVALGTPVADAVLLRSTFEIPTEVALYAADATPAVGGGFGFDSRTDPASEVGAWLSLRDTTVTVPAGGQLRVPVRLLVPPGTAGGEYVGAVVAEAVQQGTGSAVQTRTRFAMAVYVRVPGGAPGTTPGRGKPDGRLEVLAVDPRFVGGRACPVVRLRNDSQDILDPQVEVATRGLLGAGGSYRRDRSAAILPGAQADVRLPCLKRPIGPGSLDVTVRTPRGVRTEAVDFRWFPVPFVLALLFLLLLVGALVTTVARGLLRRRAAQAEGASAERPPV
ncbi:MAG: hypothetical protein JWN77_1267 [Frankiales bacterium]|jgi:hypothetical protein|nr:hypothetical protein [Frankiales bacterium]